MRAHLIITACSCYVASICQSSSIFQRTSSISHTIGMYKLIHGFLGNYSMHVRGIPAAIPCTSDSEQLESAKSPLPYQEKDMQPASQKDPPQFYPVQIDSTGIVRYLAFRAKGLQMYSANKEYEELMSDLTCQPQVLILLVSSMAAFYVVALPDSQEREEFERNFTLSCRSFGERTNKRRTLARGKSLFFR